MCFSAGEARAIRRALEAVEAEHGPVFTENRARAGAAFQGSYRYKSHLLFKWLADVIRHPAILDAVEDLIGPDILCWTTHWFVKEPHSPQYVSWHQDSNYWGVETRDLVSVWLAVSASTVESGCVRLLPGSHRTPTMEHVDTWAENNMLTRGQTIEDVDESRAVNLELAPGRGGRSSTIASPTPRTRTAAATAASASACATLHRTRARSGTSGIRQRWCGARTAAATSSGSPLRREISIRLRCRCIARATRRSARCTTRAPRSEGRQDSEPVANP